MNKLAYCTLLFVALCLFSSCTSKILGGKKSKKKNEAQTTVVTEPLKPATPQQPAAINTGIPVATPGKASVLIAELTPLWNKRIAYKTFSGKAKVSFEGPDGSADFSANFRIAKDSIVWVHITALGGLYPVARMLVTRDSFFMVNYKDKEKTLISMSDVAKILPVAVQFSQLQNLFTGDPLANGVITAADAKDSSWSVHTEDGTYLQQITYQKADSTMSLGHLETRAPNGPVALINYNSYETTNNRKVSTNRIVHIQNGLKNYTINMDLLNIEFDKELEFPFTIPGNYALKNK